MASRFEARESRIQVETSVMNLIDRSMPGAVFRRVGRFANIAQEAGYQGLQWHPVRGILAGLQMKVGMVGKRARGMIESASQSWRNERTFSEAWQHPNRKLVMVSYLLLPERSASLESIEHLQKVVGHELPVVFQPVYQEEETARPFAGKLIQPTAQLMHEWGVTTPQDLINQARARGYTGFALDLFLLRISFKDKSLNNWHETIPQLLPFTKEVQVGAGRTDILLPHSVDSQQELQDLLRGHGDSDLLKMLHLLDIHYYNGRVVTEIPAASLRELRKKAGAKWSVKALIEDHTKIVTTIKEILG